MPGLYFQEFEVGKIYRHQASRSVTQFDNTWHTCMTLNTQPLHLNLDFAAKQGLHGKPLFNSLYTLGIVIGQTVADLTRGTMIEQVGMTDIQFPRSVFDGDTIYSKTTVLRVTSDDNDETGLVDLLHEGFNQDEELVATCKRTVRVRSRKDGA
jgi:acyl dehydratase